MPNDLEEGRSFAGIFLQNINISMNEGFISIAEVSMSEMNVAQVTLKLPVSIGPRWMVEQADAATWLESFRVVLQEETES